MSGGWNAGIEEDEGEEEERLKREREVELEQRPLWGYHQRFCGLQRVKLGFKMDMQLVSF